MKTKDVHRAVVAAESMGLPCISVVNAVGSLIARTTKLGVYCNAGRENAVASTKAFTTQVCSSEYLVVHIECIRSRTESVWRVATHASTLQFNTTHAALVYNLTQNESSARWIFSPDLFSTYTCAQVTVLALLTCWFRQLRDENPATARTGRPDTLELLEALQRLPISFGMANRVRPKVKEVAARLKDKEHLFILGKGYGEPIAYEGALKIKECAYIHAEVLRTLKPRA